MTLHVKCLAGQLILCFVHVLWVSPKRLHALPYKELTRGSQWALWSFFCQETRRYVFVSTIHTSSSFLTRIVFRVCTWVRRLSPSKFNNPSNHQRFRWTTCDSLHNMTVISILSRWILDLRHLYSSSFSTRKLFRTTMERRTFFSNS